MQEEVEVDWCPKPKVGEATTQNENIFESQYLTWRFMSQITDNCQSITL